MTSNKVMMTIKATFAPGETRFYLRSMKYSDLDTYLALGFITRPDHFILRTMIGSETIDDMKDKVPMSESELRHRLHTLERKGIVSRTEF